MKRFFITTSVMGTLACVLLLSLNYSWKVVFYHASVVALIHLAVFGLIYFVASFIRKTRLQRFLINVISFSFFILYMLFNILMLGSNLFWKKTITFSILSNYLTSLDAFIGIIPVEKWIVVSLLLILLMSIIALFLFARPETGTIIKRYSSSANRKTRRIVLALTSVLLLAALIFHKPLFRVKRVIHYAEEPFLEFTLGPMWGKQNDIAFDKQRFEKGQNDESCINAVRNNPAAQRNVVIILMDALRSDHLPFYGYSRNTTPHLDSLYRAGKLQYVRQAFSTSTNTIGGISGMFFSRDWNEFGFNGLSLMKYLKRTGYSTYAFLTGFHRDWYGLSALYRSSCDYYYESSDNPEIKSDDDLVTLREFKKTKLKQRSFIFIHLLSTHVIGKKNDGLKRFFPDKMGINTDKKTALVNNYDNGILQADYVVNEVLKKLEQEHMLSNSTVFILADHGELLGENNSWRHGGSIHENLISIPWLIYDNDLTWYKNLEAATLKDVAPTIADRIQNTIPACWEGISLHQPPHDFTVAINSVEPCKYPYGILTKNDSRLRLDILNKDRQLKRVVQGNKDTWLTIKENN